MLKGADVVTKCLLCGGDTFASNDQDHYDADGVNQTNYILSKCADCGSGNVWPQPTNEELIALYSKGIYKASGGKGERIVGPVLNQLQKIRLGEINQVIEKTGRLLDIGCGKGRFLYNAVKMGWNAEGQDMSATQAAAAEVKSGAKVWVGDLESLPFSSQRYDVVTMWHVLEHLPDPEKMIGLIHDIISEGGVLVLEVPNYASWQARIGRGKWFQLDIPRHLWQFTPKGISEIMQNNGFAVTEYKTWSIELGPFGMLQTLLNRVGFPPQWLFQYLKRSGKKQSGLVIAGNIVAAICLVVPATLLEILASAWGRGGVVRVISRRLDR